jgi:hemolysin activation/secretion protein
LKSSSLGRASKRPTVRCSATVTTALTAWLVLVLAGTAFCQDLPTLDYFGRSTDRRPDLLEEIPEPTEPRLRLPDLPSDLPDRGWTPIHSAFIRTVQVVGSTVFTPEEIATVTATYEGRTLSVAEVESLRRDLTLLYVNRGYVNSGAVVPDQALTDGVLTLQVVEGRLTQIDVTGTRWFREAYLRDRIALGAEPPVNVLPLQERLQLLQQDQRIQLIHAELRPGVAPGEADLVVRVEERTPFSVWLAFNNYQSPSVGAERGLITLAHENLTGRGDLLSFTYGYSEGLNPLIDTWYAVPVTARDTTLMVRYRKNDATVVDRIFGPLDIVTKTDALEAALRRPFYRSLSQEFALSLSMEYQDSETTLDGTSFSFIPGLDDGRTVVVPIRFAQEWTHRTQQQAFAARSRFSYGLDIFGATTNGNAGPDAQFFSWLGQLQWARNLAFLDTQLLARADLQLSADPLLPVEQVAIGGRYSVRGYRENFIVSDEAFIGSIEARVPIIRDRPWAEYVQIAPFFDYGRGDNVRGPSPDPKDISSIGLGLRWGVPLPTGIDLRADAEIYWGHQLRNVDMPSDEGLQDDGIHFQVALMARF